MCRIKLSGQKNAVSQTPHQPVSSDAPSPGEIRHALRELGGGRERELAHAVAEQARRIEALEAAVTSYETSTFWRLTSPARAILERAPRAARTLRLSVKSCWWIVSGQFPARVRIYRQKQRELRALRPSVAASPRPVAALDESVQDHGPIGFPRHANPVLSIIIPCYGQVSVTLRCLRSLMRHSPSRPYEVIVAEDASGDQEIERLRSISGLVLIERPSNLGFLRNCNAAARVASGAYLHFLNNDTELLDGALDALLERLREDASIGLVGSKLLYPDGSLQEAGGIIWNDASGWNFGRHDPRPDRAAYSYPRDVDYVSGASIMLRRDLFESLNGFDEAFAPAYYEDTDLAFRIRASGLRVVFEPASAVIHHEGVSHGTDETVGVKACQSRNRHLMQERWRDVLAREHYPSGTHLLRAVSHAHDRRTILIIDHYVPEPDRDAGSRATMCVIRALLAAGWLVVFWPENRQRTPYSARLEHLGVRIIDETDPHDFSGWMALNGADLDHVMIMRPMIARAFLPDVILYSDARRSYYGHDIHFLRLEREAETTGNPEVHRQAVMMRRQETWLWPQFHSVLYLSRYEAELVRELAPASRAHAIVPFCFEPSFTDRSPPAAPLLLFVGGFGHPPNVDAALWLVGEILPRVRGLVPKVRLVLAGSRPAPEVQALAGRDVTVTGSISDMELTRLYAQARAAAIPLRFGAGVKNKVLEALHHGLPLVTTPTGAEGIPDLETVASVESATDGFVQALATLLSDDTLWGERSRAGKKLIATHYSPEHYGTVLLNALTG